MWREDGCKDSGTYQDCCVIMIMAPIWTAAMTIVLMMRETIGTKLVSLIGGGLLYSFLAGSVKGTTQRHTSVTGVYTQVMSGLHTLEVDYDGCRLIYCNYEQSRYKK